MSQLQMPFVVEMDRQLANEREAARVREHEKWAASILRSMVEHYPPRAEEWDVMLSGVRLARFVSHLECERCPYATQDHTAGMMFRYWEPTYGSNIYFTVCLKDYYRFRKRLGLKRR